MRTQLSENPIVAVVGTGPAGLMAATAAAEAGLRVQVFDKRRAPGRKLLVAGSSGLNITYDAPLDEFVAHYTAPDGRMRAAIEAFPPSAWLKFVESLGVGTFKGTSRRFFIEGMKAPVLLKAWVRSLEARGVRFAFGKELSGFEAAGGGRVRLEFADGSGDEFAAAALCLGGGSWEPAEKPLRWPEIFRARGLGFREFRSSNVGFRVDWPRKLVEEAEGKPIKNVVLTSSRGRRSGDLVITAYGLEGTPVYFAGEEGTVHLDLKPDLSAEELRRRLEGTRENLSPPRRVKKLAKLSEGAEALVFHLAPWSELGDLERLARLLKAFPVELKERQPLDEAISSSGGLDWAELDEALMLRRFPGVFVAGEMLDWDAPTGGFLIQGCAALGFAAGRGMAGRLLTPPSASPRAAQKEGA